jgi:hypothetical protein
MPAMPLPTTTNFIFCIIQSSFQLDYLVHQFKVTDQ